MTHQLPPPLLRFFTPRPPLEYAAPLKRDVDPNARPRARTQEEIDARRVRPLEGVAGFLERARRAVQDDAQRSADAGAPSAPTDAVVTLVEMRREQRQRERRETRARMEKEYDPKADTHAVGDPFKTLFLSRLVRAFVGVRDADRAQSYDTTERELHREFDRYGPIENIRVVRDPSGKSRGYAFILYERERDMRTAYSRAEGIRIDGRKIMVDVERGRTVRDWKPKRLGGGLGGHTRRARDKRAEAMAARGFRRGGGPFRGGRGGRGGRHGDMDGGWDRPPRDHGYQPYRDRDGPAYRDGPSIRDASSYRDRDAGYSRPASSAMDDRTAKRPRW